MPEQAHLMDVPFLLVVLFVLSGVFMTIAWYGHLKFKLPLIAAIGIGWLIAFCEYVVMIPAIRYGFVTGFNLVQLKALQEVTAIVVFVGFATFYLKEKLTLQHWFGFALMAAGLYVLFGV